jgi:transcriptional regulator with XRE-family HTH domain
MMQAATETAPTTERRRPSATHMWVVLQKRLRVARAAQQKSQLAVATYIGVTRQAFSLWENGQTIPPADKLCAWCAFLHLTLGVTDADGT